MMGSGIRKPEFDNTAAWLDNGGTENTDDRIERVCVRNKYKLTKGIEYTYEIQADF